MRIVSSVSGGASRTNSMCLPDLFLVKISLVSCGVLIVSTWEDLRCTWPMIERKMQIYKQYTGTVFKLMVHIPLLSTHGTGRPANVNGNLPRISRWISQSSCKFPFICGHVKQLWVLRVAVSQVLRETSSWRGYTFRTSWCARARCCVKNK